MDLDIINVMGEVSDEQTNLIKEGSFQGFTEDKDRIRLITKDGRKGPWFSKLWSNLTIDKVIGDLI